MVAADGPLHGHAGMRLAKDPAPAGAASRRAAQAPGAARPVTVDGEIVTDPARDVQPGTRVAVDGEALGGPEPRAVFALNKPLGVLSTARDTHGRPTVL